MAKLDQALDGDLSDEEFIIVPHAKDYGLRPFRWEPTIDRDLYEQSSEEEGDRAEESEQIRDGNNRVGAPVESWCACGRCSGETLTDEREHVCCQELIATRVLASPTHTDESICITNNGDFAILCLNRVVLENTLVCLNSTRQDGWNLDPPSNRALRWASYRQFSWRVHRKLRRRERKVIPACAIHAIRKHLPSPNADYEGFHSEPNSESDTE